MALPPRLSRLLAHGIVALAVAPVAVVAACADSTDSGPGPGVDAGSGTDGGRRDGSGGSNDGAVDSAPKSTCELTRAYFEGCGNDGDLNCGASGFDAWCDANDKTINSAAYRRAEAACLTQDNCDGKDRRACEYEHYNDETPTASQTALVAAYCETCEPSDVAGCTERSTKYDAAKGIETVADIFIAAWEFADAIVDEMKTSCTGAATDAGSDSAACAKAFASCAADVYLTRLPDCPE
jgi:hypothetical protein